MSGIIAQNTLDSSGLIKAPEGGGAWTVIKKITASSDASISFLNGTSDVVFDATYPIYLFQFINIHPASSADFTFQVDTGTNTSYNQTITSTFHQMYHSEDDTSNAVLDYRATGDQAQGTAFQRITGASGNANDDNLGGYLYIFAPADTTYAKHFITSVQTVGGAESNNAFASGYVNTTTALTRVQFKFTSGNIDAGDIVLMGLSSS